MPVGRVGVSQLMWVVEQTYDAGPQHNSKIATCDFQPPWHSEIENWRQSTSGFLGLWLTPKPCAMDLQALAALALAVGNGRRRGRQGLRPGLRNRRQVAY